MASNFSEQKMDSSGDTGMLSPEKMLEKYKEKYTAALTIAQKAKNARDEAIKNNKIILAENDVLRDKIRQLEKQYGTAEEMLAALTDQKLKLAMEIDDLKKQNVVFAEELKAKEKASIEAESYKRQYNRLLKENEDIINKFGSSELESVHLRNEFEDLKKNNDALKQLYINVQSEKEDLDKSFKETLQRLCDLEENQKALNSSLSQKFNVAVNKMEEWIEIINDKTFSSSEDLGAENNCSKTLYDSSSDLVISLTKEKENLEQEIVELNERITTMRQELDIANSDRDKMMNNLEKVGLETKQLIENSERLTDEISILKQEKSRQDILINSLQNEKELLSSAIKENEEEVNRLCMQLREIQRHNDELILKMESLENPSYSGSCNILDENQGSVGFVDNSIKEIVKNGEKLFHCEDKEHRKENCSEKEKSVSRELNELQEELQVFSCEIGKYKQIADDFKLKYESALMEIMEKSEIINELELCSQNLKMRVLSYEEQQKALSTSLSECKLQLLSALNDLSNAEEIKNRLEEESALKDHKLASTLLELNQKDVIITEKSEKLKKLETELKSKNFSQQNTSTLIQKNEVEAAIDQEEASTLMDCTHELKLKNKSKYQKCQEEISELKIYINDLKQYNEKLSINNTNLNKKMKDLLNEQADDNCNLVTKLTSLQDSLQSQLKEKQSIITSLEQEVSSLKSEILLYIQQSENISSENTNLKTQNHDLLSKSAKECAVLANENAELKEQLNSLLLQANERDTNITNLRADLNNIIKVRDFIEKGRDLLIQEKTHLDDVIQETTTSLIEINSKIESDICKLKGENKSPSVPQSDNKTAVNMIMEYTEKLKMNHFVLYEELSKLLNLNDLLLKENSSVKEQLSNLLSESSKLSDRLSELETVKISLEKSNNALKDLEEEKCELIKKIEELTSNNQLLFAKINEADTECLSLKNYCSDLEKTLMRVEEEKKNEINQQQNKIESLNESLLKMEEKLTKYTEIEKSISDQELTTNNLAKQCSVFEEENIFLKKQNTELEDAATTVKKELQCLQSSYLDKENDYKKELEKREKILTEYNDSLQAVNDKCTEMSSLNNTLTLELCSFKDNLEILQKKYAEDTNSLLDKNKKLQGELNNCNELLTFKTLELKENNRIWAGRFASLKIALIGLNKARKEIKNHFECMENLFSSFMGHIKDPLQDKVNLAVEHSLSAAKFELINEMHQMNQALKERGENISKMEFALSEYQVKLKQYATLNESLNTELLQVKEELKNLQESLREKDLNIKQLEHENEQLKETHYNTTDTDVLSTSTISKTEEYSRLKDVEDSFEDRYSKLKLLAVKMKKRIAELNQTLETERSKISSERTEFQEKITSMSIAVKNAQKLQELFDQSLDERDELVKKNKAFENTLEELKNSLESSKSKIATLETNNQNIPVMKKHIDSLNAVIKDSKAEIHKLQMENKAENIKYEELKKNYNKLESKIQELTRSLEQAKQQGKNSNVLELEMKNYEKIVSDLSLQLNQEKTFVRNLQNENEALLNMKVSLEEQITILEKQIKVEEERNQNAKEQLDSCRTKLEENAIQAENLNLEVENLQKLLSLEKNKTDALTIEMSQVTSEFSKKEMSLMSKIGSLQEQIRSLETNLQSTKQELITSKHEIDHLNEEYEGYKLRAQAILAKRKGEFITHGEKEAKGEVERLKKDCKILEEKLEAYVTEIETLNTRISSLNLEKARNDKKVEDLRLALQQKIADFDLMNTEFYNFKISNEAIIDNLKGELAKKQQEYQFELSQQKKIIDELALEFKLREDNNQISNKDKMENSGFGIGFQDSQPLPSEREDGEGSESVPSPKARRHSSVVVPLDILLNNPILDENKVAVLQEQVEKLRRELTSYEVRCRHLSSLLSEAEKDSARNLHQNKLLKEELRRLERSLERQPHVANTEYLKNIIFKFITLPNGDEKSRLIPVLDTLLKLSPEETHKLNIVVKGESQPGWSSYFQSWTS